jgi:Tir chaperone protein (CesT) family
VSFERYQELVTELCTTTELGDPTVVLETKTLEVEGFTVLLDHFEDDANAMYMQFDYGIVTAGRTLRIFRMMLESNLLVYAQDQAQLGLNPDTGGVLLILRIPMGEDITGTWFADTLVHYAEHGRYWRDNMSTSIDDMFEGIASGEFAWLRA